MTNAPSPLPQTWDLTSYFPSFDGPEFRTFTAALAADLKTSLAHASALSGLTAGAASVNAWVGAFTAWEGLVVRLTHLASYLGCLSAADSASEVYQAEEARLSLLSAEESKLKTQLLRGLRSADDAAFAALLAAPEMGQATHALRRFRAEAVFQMAAEHEALASDLGVDGFKAWSRLYDTLTGKMAFEMTFPDGHRETVPMANRRALMTNPNRAIRRAAFTEGNKIWSAAGDTCAAALNALAGTRHTLYARRGRGHFLDAPLHDAAVARETLDAMVGAITENYALPRRIMGISARLQGTPALAWYDLDTPCPLDPMPPLTWEEGVAMVQGAFDASYPRLGDYFRTSVARSWLEAEKRANKRAGAFCTGSPLTREERIYMTFNGTVGDVVTLAHEAGHAWHSHLLGDRRPVAREYPMTLAETASTFAEKILVHGLLSAPGLTPARRAFLLDMETNHMPAYLLNIPVRFMFERRFYEERKAGLVSVSRLCELMTQAQREVYGEALAVGAEDPWFWASKLHFFIAELSFYNFPYTFGFLLSQALFAQFQREGAVFLPRYEEFLRATGRASCEEAVRTTLGWEIREPAFWSGAIAACQPPIDAFEQAINRLGAG
jgi:oligoendopeptidase F